MDLFVCKNTSTTTKYLRIETDRGISWEEVKQMSEANAFSLGFYNWKGKPESVGLAVRKDGRDDLFAMIKPNNRFTESVQPMLVIYQNS